MGKKISYGINIYIYRTSSNLYTTDSVSLASLARQLISTEQLRGGVRNWRASEASETLSGVYKFELVRYIYIYIYMYGGTYAILVAHATHT